MRKALLAAAAAAAVVTAGSPALASAATAPVVHHARCTGTAAHGLVFCNMLFHVGRHPGDVRVVIRASREQRVDGVWFIGCGLKNDGSGHMRGATVLRMHLVGRVKAGGRCVIGAGVEGHKGGSLTMVFSWVNR